MKFVILCLASCAIFGISQAQFQDSPAVAAAKAAHFEAVRRAESIIANAPPPSVINQTTRKPVVETTQHKLGLNVHDTPEVAAAKSAHYQAVRDAAEASAIANSTAKYPDLYSGTQQHHHVPAVYSPPPPTPSPTYYPPTVPYHMSPVQYHRSMPFIETTQHKLGVNVHETPEVAAARAAHIEAYRQAEKTAALAGPMQYEETYVMVPSYQKLGSIVPEVPSHPRYVEATPQHYGQRAHQMMYEHMPYHQNNEYNSHIQMIPVVAVPQTNQHKNGFNVVDTPEVAAAKAAHFEAFRQAALVAAEEPDDYPGPQNNYFANPTRQYGQVHY